MRGLKIQNKWISMILDGSKTMELRGQKYKLLGQTIVIGNSKTKFVEGYVFVKEIVKVPFAEIMRYQDEHRASFEDFKRLDYDKKEFIYGYRLIQVTKEPNPFPYPKNPGIFFEI